MKIRRSVACLALAFACALAPPQRAAKALPFEPSVTKELASQVPPKRARHRLPDKPELAWQARLQGSVTYAPAVSDDGDIVVATTGRLSQLDSRGKLAWSHRVRGASAVAGPVIAPNAHRVIITSRSELLALDPRGQLAARSALPVPVGGRLVGPIATRESTLALAFGRSVLLCDLRGEVIATTQSSGAVAALSTFRERIWITTRDGRVERWTPGVDLRQVGELGGTPTAVELVPPSRLVGIVDQKRLVEVDLTQGKRRVLADDETLAFVGMPVVDPATGTAHMTSSDGLLVSHAPTGREIRRVLLSPGVGTTTTLGGSPHLLLGVEGRVAFVLPTGDLGVVHGNGNVERASTSSCRTPVAVVSTRQGELVVACGSGLIVGYRTETESDHEDTGAPPL